MTLLGLLVVIMLSIGIISVSTALFYGAEDEIKFVHYAKTFVAICVFLTATAIFMFIAYQLNEIRIF